MSTSPEQLSSWRDWAWPVALGAVIFHASSQSVIAGPDVVGFDKVAHFLVYGLLATLVVRIPSLRRRERFPVWAAILVASAYGLSDEIHQTFTPGREVDTLDWLVDTAGGALAVAVYVRWHAYRRWLESALVSRAQPLQTAPSESSP